MNPTDQPEPSQLHRSAPIPREDFEHFLHELIHDIRNRLNGIALEAADLAEEAGSPLIAGRLQRRVQDCSAHLRKIRETLAPEDHQAETLPLAEFVKKLRERHLGEDK